MSSSKLKNLLKDTKNDFQYATDDIFNIIEIIIDEIENLKKLNSKGNKNNLTD